MLGPIFALPMLLVAYGLFEIWCCKTDQDFFFDIGKVARRVRWAGREGARKYFMIAGGFRVIAGTVIFIALKYLQSSGM